MSQTRKIFLIALTSLLALVAVFAYSNYYSSSGDEVNPDTKSDQVAPIDEAECSQLGGKWGVWKNTPDAVSSCNLTTTDGGEVCTDSSECESYCQAAEGSKIGDQVSGECYGHELALCMKEVVDGVVQPQWCF